MIYISANCGDIAVMAGVLRPHCGIIRTLRRDHVEPFGGVVADANHAVAAGALRVRSGSVEDLIDARQRQRPRLAARARRRCLARGDGRFG